MFVCVVLLSKCCCWLKLYAKLNNLQALQNVESKNDIRALCELLLVLTYYESSFDRAKKKNLDIKVLCSVYA